MSRPSTIDGCGNDSLHIVCFDECPSSGSASVWIQRYIFILGAYSIVNWRLCARGVYIVTGLLASSAQAGQDVIPVPQIPVPKHMLCHFSTQALLAAAARTVYFVGSHMARASAGAVLMCITGLLPGLCLGACIIAPLGARACRLACRHGVLIWTTGWPSVLVAGMGRSRVVPCRQPYRLALTCIDVLVPLVLPVRVIRCCMGQGFACCCCLCALCLLRRHS